MSNNDNMLELLTDAIANTNDLRTAYDPQTQSVTIVADDLAKAVLPAVQSIIAGTSGPRPRAEVPGKARRKVSIRSQLKEAFVAGAVTAPNSNTDDEFDKWIETKRAEAAGAGDAG